MKSEKVNPQGQVLGDLAGMAGFEPTNAGVKVPCLTAWRHPNRQMILYHISEPYVNSKNKFIYLIILQVILYFGTLDSRTPIWYNILKVPRICAATLRYI